MNAQVQCRIKAILSDGTVAWYTGLPDEEVLSRKVDDALDCENPERAIYTATQLNVYCGMDAPFFVAEYPLQ